VRQRLQEFQIGGTREEREGNRSNHCAGKVACLTNPVVTTARVVLLLTRALRVRLSARPSLRSLSCFEECDEDFWQSSDRTRGARMRRCASISSAVMLRASGASSTPGVTELTDRCGVLDRPLSRAMTLPRQCTGDDNEVEDRHCEALKAPKQSRCHGVKAVLSPFAHAASIAARRRAGTGSTEQMKEEEPCDTTK